MATLPPPVVMQAIYTQTDRIAKWYDVIRTALSADDGVSFWEQVDATDVEAYENTVSGASLSSLDSAFGAVPVGTVFREWINQHSNYARVSQGYASFDAMITAMGFRVHEWFAAVYAASTGGTLSARNIFADSASRIWATVTSTDDPSVTVVVTDWNALTSLVPTTMGPTPVKVTVSEAPGSGKTQSFDVTGYALSTDSTGADFTVAVSDAGVITITEGGGTNGILGQTDIDTNPALGASSIVVTSVDGIPNVANSYILISETISDVPTYQYVKIASVNTNTNTITFASGEALRHDFSGSALVSPCFQRISEPVESSSGHDAVSGVTILAPAPDRVIGW